MRIYVVILADCVQGKCYWKTGTHIYTYIYTYAHTYATKQLIWFQVLRKIKTSIYTVCRFEVHIAVRCSVSARSKYDALASDDSKFHILLWKKKLLPQLRRNHNLCNIYALYTIRFSPIYYRDIIVSLIHVSIARYKICDCDFTFIYIRIKLVNTSNIYDIKYKIKYAIYTI